MSDVKISALPGASTPLGGTEVVAGVQSGATVKITVGDIAALTSSQLFAQTQTVTVASSVAETSIDGTGVGSKTIAADYFSAGRTVSILAMGYHSAVSNPTLTIKVKFGSTVILSTGAISTANSTNAMWQVRAMITCRTTGASGTVAAQGSWLESGQGANVYGMVNTSAVTIDTTATQAVTITAQWGTSSSSNTISCSNFVLEGSTG